MIVVTGTDPVSEILSEKSSTQNGIVTTVTVTKISVFNYDTECDDVSIETNIITESEHMNTVVTMVNSHNFHKKYYEISKNDMLVNMTIINVNNEVEIKTHTSTVRESHIDSSPLVSSITRTMTETITENELSSPRTVIDIVIETNIEAVHQGNNVIEHVIETTSEERVGTSVRQQQDFYFSIV